MLETKTELAEAEKEVEVADLRLKELKQLQRSLPERIFQAEHTFNTALQKWAKLKPGR